MIKTSPSILSLCLVASLQLPNYALSDDLAPQVDRWRFTTFGTLGTSHTQGDDFMARRDLSQPESFEGDWSWKLDSLVGGQVNAALTDSISLVIQGVFKSRPEQSLERSIERAFIGWQATPDWRFHAGRLGLDFYMLSDYRDVGFAYLWMRPPAEFYAPAYLQGLDGVDVVFKRPIGSGSVVTRLFAGNNERDLILDGAGINTVELAPVWGGSVTFENERWRMKIGGTRLRFDNQLAGMELLRSALNDPAVQTAWPAAATYADALVVKGKTFGYYSLGASYHDNRWQIDGEIGYIESEWVPVPDTSSAYLSIGRHIGTLTPYLLLATIRPDHGAPRVPLPPSASSPAAAAQLLYLHGSAQSVFHVLRFDQDTVSVGARWDIHSNIALKLQWDHTEINATGAGLWSNQTGLQPAPAATVNLVSASLNWVY